MESDLSLGLVLLCLLMQSTTLSSQLLFVVLVVLVAGKKGAKLETKKSINKIINFSQNKTEYR